MKNLALAMGIASLASGCQPPENVGMAHVVAAYETEPASADPETDAADDPAIWYNEADPEQSLIIGTDKTNGIDLFSMKGKRLQTYLVGRINNVDVRNDMPWGSSKIDIVGASNRSTNTLDFWRVEPDSLTLTALGQIPTDLPDVYGFCLYQNRDTRVIYAFINSKTGRIEQWKLYEENDGLRATMVRTLKLDTQVEGMVADDEMGVLYVGEEGTGIFKFAAAEDASSAGTYLLNSGEDNGQIKYDVEGLAIYTMEGGTGYLIASSQGNYSYAVFDRAGQNKYLGSFEIKDGSIDGVEETDGLEISPYSFGALYPSGLLICQDGYNYEGENKVAQNFKMVHWSDIAQSFDPPLSIAQP